MTDRTTDQQWRRRLTSDEEWEEIRRKYEAAREKQERALRRWKQLDRRHQQIRRASGWRGVLRTLFLP